MMPLPAQKPDPFRALLKRIEKYLRENSKLVLLLGAPVVMIAVAFVAYDTWFYKTNAIEGSASSPSIGVPPAMTVGPAGTAAPAQTPGAAAPVDSVPPEATAPSGSAPAASAAATVPAGPSPPKGSGQSAHRPVKAAVAPPAKSWLPPGFLPSPPPPNVVAGVPAAGAAAAGTAAAGSAAAGATAAAEPPPQLGFDTFAPMGALVGAATAAIPPEVAAAHAAPPPAASPPTASALEPSAGNLEEVSVAAVRRSGPYWNFWIEAASQKTAFKPELSAQPNDDFRLVVDLSQLQLRLRAVISQGIAVQLRKWLSEEHDPVPALEVMVIPDTKAFRFAPNEIRLKSLPLNLNPLRQDFVTPDISTEAALAQLRSHRGKAPFDLGNVSFLLSAGSAVGPHNIGLMFWAHKKNVGRIPVGEASVPVCISATPADESQCVNELTDSSPAAPILSGATRILPADGAFDIVELDEDNVVGTFRCNGCPGWGPDEILSWRLANNMSGMAAYVSTTLKAAFEHAADANNDPGRAAPDWTGYARAGRDFYNLLFASPEDAANADLVQKRLTAFIEKEIQDEKGGGPEAKSRVILFRMFSRNPGDFPVLPLNLMSVPLTDGSSEYLGAHFRIRQALYYPSPRAPSACISSWRVLVPPATLSDPIATAARPPLAQWIVSFQRVPQQADVSEDLVRFGEWLDPSNIAMDAANNAAPDGAGVVVLSHHEGNRLFFDSSAQDVGIDSQGITRVFGNPSAAIIDACGAADPKAFDVMQQLNRHGVSAIIASTTKVDAAVGGKFLATLLDVAAAHAKSAGYSLQLARYEAARQLSQDPHIGPQPLSFGYFGDDDIAVCLPPKVAVDAP
jgi:hypothetical protein